MRQLASLFVFSAALGCTVQSHEASPLEPKEKPTDVSVDLKKTDDPKVKAPRAPGAGPTDESTAGAGPGSSTAVPVTASLSLQLFLSRSGDATPPTTYLDVRPLLQKCLPCHGPGQRSPNFSSFPFVGLGEETLGSVIHKMKRRISDVQSPMPPSGMLPADQRAVLNAWIDAGSLEVPPAPAASSEFLDYAVELKWTVDGKETDSHVDGSSSGAFAQALGSLPIGTGVSVAIKVIGLGGVAVLEASYSALILPSSGTLHIPLRAIAVDRLPPVPGDLGELRSENVTHNSASLSWSAAIDGETPANAVSYTLYKSQADNLNSVASIKQNGAPTGASAMGRLSAIVTGLNASSQYFFNVIARDAAGNEAAFKVISLTTEDDPNIVVVSEYPNCISGNQTRPRIAAWRNAAALALQSGASESTVAGFIRQCFSAQVPSCIQPSLDYATRNDLAAAGSDRTAETSPQKQPPAAFLAPAANGLEYVIPADIERTAANNGWPTVRYKSRHAGGFDGDTPSLLMVYVPGDKVSPPVNFDRWLNFATPVDSVQTALTPLPQAALATEEDYAPPSFGQNLPRVFTMVSLERRSGNRPAEVYFQMFDREANGSKFTPRGNSDVASDCVSCHPNGLRAISPLGLHVRRGEPALPDRDWKAAEEINKAMDLAAGGKAISWRTAVESSGSASVRRPFFNPASQGPILGPVVPLNEAGSRSKEFIMGTSLPNGQLVGGCFNTRKTVRVVDIFRRAPGLNNIYSLSAAPNVRWEKVRDSMKCASCHDNVVRGGINATMDMSQVDFKILVDQSMPLGAHVNPLEQESGQSTTPVRDDLTGDERIALANCLAAEFDLEKVQLQKWLTQSSCQ